MKKEAVLNNIDFKELAKNCKSSDDISKLTKEFMKSVPNYDIILKLNIKV